jgi:hypothetical protein
MAYSRECGTYCRYGWLLCLQDQQGQQILHQNSKISRNPSHIVFPTRCESIVTICFSICKTATSSALATHFTRFPVNAAQGESPRERSFRSNTGRLRRHEYILLVIDSDLSTFCELREEKQCDHEEQEEKYGCQWHTWHICSCRRLLCNRLTTSRRLFLCAASLIDRMDDQATQ